MLARLIPLPWLIAIAMLVAGGALGGAYLKGRADGRAVVSDKLKDDRITILKDGKKVDDEVFSADDHSLCALLGGCGLPSDKGAD
ncbi:hypothetical protein [Allomesorhizobium alhagi]|uniref:Uncharacterized protein n=1 Tax=Mesorhizobium alhagi CCNWXJ12-2 TaxID=1107882 RepID=H0HNF9_9HYPH|nr:hypothetical protein [Mesorhizobium alhagi]EHK57731.1 hypothetical protein MAXJ12_08409 [Mesorhizobium alhagi CCNWXJ12-2]